VISNIAHRESNAVQRVLFRSDTRWVRRFAKITAVAAFERRRIGRNEKLAVASPAFGEN